MTMQRNADGTWRNNRKPIKVGPKVIIARWVEAEVIRRKQRLAYSFETIAEQITQIGRGQLQPIVALPAGVTFPADYSITGRACGMAFSKGLARMPNLAAADMRRLDSERYEDLYRALQPGIIDGSARHVDSAARVLENKARLNGYLAPQGPMVQVNQNNLNKNSTPAELESKVNLLRDAIGVLRDLGVPSVIDLPESDFKALPAAKTDPNDPA
jgi:hypothetical protein